MRLYAKTANTGHVFLQDLVIPVMRAPSMLQSPLLGNEPHNRTMLAFFRGAFREHEPKYSHGIRQSLLKLAREHDWQKNYHIFIGPGEDIPGVYSELLASSIFCLVLPGRSLLSYWISNHTSWLSWENIHTLAATWVVQIFIMALRQWLISPILSARIVVRDDSSAES